MIDAEKAARFGDGFLAATNIAARGGGPGSRRWVWQQWAALTAEGATERRIGGVASSISSVEDDELFVHIITDLQRTLFDDDDDVDGYFGEMTLRRLEALIDSTSPVQPHETPPGTDYLVYGGDKLVIAGVNIVSLDEPGALELTSGRGRWGKTKPTNLAMLHWDVCLSAKSCYRVLKARGLSSAGCVDNDGTFYQFLDPAIHYGWHGGTPANKKCAFSMDLSNAVNLKYAARYEKAVGKPRPVIVARYHGKSKKILGMYTEQVIATLRILKAIAEVAKLPLQFPMSVGSLPGVDGKVPRPSIKERKSYVFGPQYKGAMTHLHATRKKWDVAGFEDQVIALLMLNAPLRDEFPELCEAFKLSENHWWPWIQHIRTEWTWPGVL